MSPFLEFESHLCPNSFNILGNVRAKAEKLFSSYFTGEFSLKQPLPSSFIQYKFTKCSLFKNEFA